MSTLTGGIRIGLDMKGFENLVKSVSAIDKNFIRARNSTLASVGFLMKKEAQSEIRKSGAAYGWPPKNRWSQTITDTPARKSHGLKNNSFFQFPTSKNTPLWGKLGKAIAYKQYKDTGRVFVGILTGGRQFSYSIGKTFHGTHPKAADLAQMIQDGYQVAVTPKLRKYFAALGILLARETRNIKIPSRKLFSPLYKRLKDYIPRRFESKFMSALARYSGTFAYRDAQGEWIQ